MPTFFAQIAAAVAWFVLSTFAAPIAFAGSLNLHLTNGTTIACSEIADADAVSLSLVSSSNNIRISRRLSWSQIAGASLNGNSYSTSDLCASLGLPVNPLPTAQPVDSVPAVPLITAYSVSPACQAPCFLPRSPGRIIGVRPDPTVAYADFSTAIYPNGIPSSEVPFALRLFRERRRIEAIGPFLSPAAYAPPAPVLSPPPLGEPLPGPLSQIESRVTPIRRNGAADINALGIELLGFDENGTPIPVHGTAQLTLFALEQRLVNAYDNAFAAQPERLTRLAEWSRQINADASVIVRLPEPLPDHNPNLSPVGSLQVKLNVPGIGVFETLSEPITLRSPSLLRDAIRAESGTRFLPDEKTSGSRLQIWPRQPDLSSVD